MKKKTINTRTFVIGGGTVDTVEIGTDQLAFIGGPCAIESRDHTMRMAEEIKKISERQNIPLVFKACFDKDCRSSTNSFCGIGVDSGLKILEEVRQQFALPVTTDVSNVEWMTATSEVVDLIQIPAYLCRQTHLLVAAGKTNLPINIKKGQFMGPWNMANSVKKVISRTGNDKIILAERGTFFGYNMLVNDFRGLEAMRETKCPICYDATHSIQLPTNLGTISGGQREYILPLVRAACSIGIDVLFMEVHDNPDQALSDSATQYPLDQLEDVLIQAKRFHELRQEYKNILYHE